MTRLCGSTLRERAIAHINQRPGISQDQLCVVLGFSVRVHHATRTNLRNPTVAQLIRELVEKQLIRTERAQFAKSNEPLRLYPIDYKPKEKRLFQPSKQPECRVYHDPSVIANPTLPNPEMPKPPRDRDQIRQALQDSLKILIDQGKPFTLEQWADEAETAISVLYKPNYADIRAEGQEAIARLKRTTVKGNALDAHLSKVAPNAKSNSHLPDVDPTVATLELKLRELEEQNQKLREQLSQSRSPQVVDRDAIALEVLRADEQALAEHLKRIDDEVVRLGEEHKRIVAHLHAVRQAISLRTNEPAQPEFVMVVENGNGKVAA